MTGCKQGSRSFFLISAYWWIDWERIPLGLSFRIMKFSCITQGVRFVLQFLSRRLIHCGFNFFLLRGKFLLLLICLSFCTGKQFFNFFTISCTTLLKSSVCHLAWPVLYLSSLISQLIRLLRWVASAGDYRRLCLAVLVLHDWCRCNIDANGNTSSIVSLSVSDLF